MKVLISTRNAHKLKEIQAIFSFSPVEFVTVDSFPDLPEVEEDGKTFEANAVKKAVTLALITKMWTLADDSGLEVDSLGGAPGVWSARYAGEPVDYEANNEKLLNELKNYDDRSARFRCVIALSSPEGSARIVEGKCEGMISTDLRGDNGFGYDPLFVPEGGNKTFAEMTSDMKNGISHRSVALKLASEEFREVLLG